MDETYRQWSQAFQRRALALLIREPASVYHIVEPEYFTDPILLDIARTVKTVYEKHDVHEVRISRATLWMLLKSSLGKSKQGLYSAYRITLRKLYQDSIRDKDIVVDQVLQFARSRRYHDALIAAEQDVSVGRYDAVHQRIDGLKGFGKDNDLGIQYWGDIGSRDRYRDDRSGIVPTLYFPRLDKMMGGGPGAGELVVVLGVGKVGKTTLLGRVATGALWKAKNVAIASGELSARKYRKRIDVAITGIQPETWMRPWKMRHGTRLRWLDRVQKDLRGLHRQMKGELYIKQFPTGKGTPAAIEVWLDQLAEAGTKIDILVVDYLFTFSPNIRTKERRINIGQLAVELRGIAVERGIPVWTASQGNRAALTKKRLYPQDLAEDISIFWTLDFLLALCQSKDEAEMDPPRGRIYLTSARDVGHGGVVQVTMDQTRYRITEEGVVEERREEPKKERYGRRPEKWNVPED